MSKSTEKLRAVNRPDRPAVGKQRQDLYRCAYKRIKDAVEAGFMLEAITLCESVIADRMEARRACIHDQKESKRKFGTLGSLIKDLRGQAKGSFADPNSEIQDVYTKISEWANRRNEALHEMVKLSEFDQTNWDVRYEGLHKVARDGKRLAREIGNLVTKLNRASYSKVKMQNDQLKHKQKENSK